MYFEAVFSMQCMVSGSKEMGEAAAFLTGIASRDKSMARLAQVGMPSCSAVAACGVLPTAPTLSAQLPQ